MVPYAVKAGFSIYMTEVMDMKVAVSATGPGLDSSVDPRFGRANYFVIVESETGEIAGVIDNRSAQDAAHGAGINAATLVAESGANVVLTGQVGPKAYAVLEAAGIRIVSGAAGTVKEAVQKFASGGASGLTGPTCDAHQGLAPPSQTSSPGMVGGGGRGMGGGGRGMGGGGGRGCGGGRGMGGGRRQ